MYVDSFWHLYFWEEKSKTQSMRNIIKSVLILKTEDLQGILSVRFIHQSSFRFKFIRKIFFSYVSILLNTFLILSSINCVENSKSYRNLKKQKAIDDIRQAALLGKLGVLKLIEIPSDEDKGSLFVVGYKSNDPLTTSWWIKKFSTKGEENTTEWNREFQSPGISIPYGIAYDSSKNIFVIGSGGNGTWLVKGFTPDGKDFIGGNIEVSTFGNSKGLAISIQNGFAYMGGEAGTSSCYEWAIKKFSFTGGEDKSWNKRFQWNNQCNSLRDLKLDAEGNVHAVGYGNYPERQRYIKFNSRGEILWNKEFQIYDTKHSIERILFDSAGNSYSIGWMNQQDNANTEWWLKKIHPDGSEDSDFGNLTFQNGNGIYMTGEGMIDAAIYGSTIYMIGPYASQISGGFDWVLRKIPTSGNREGVQTSTITAGGHNNFHSMTMDSKGNIYVCGAKHNGTDLDWRILKIPNDGKTSTLAWEKIYDGGKGNDEAMRILYVP